MPLFAIPRGDRLAGVATTVPQVRHSRPVFRSSDDDARLVKIDTMLPKAFCIGGLIPRN